MQREPLIVVDKSINHEAAAFTQHYKLLCISIDRLSKFLDNNHWTDANMSTKRLYYDKCPPISIGVYSPKHTQNETRPSFSTVMQEAKWDKCEIGQSFGPSWSTHWFKLMVKPKEIWDKSKEIHLLWNSNSEATLWSENGICLQGFAGEWEQKREEYIFDKHTKFPLTLYVEMACNHRFGNGQDGYQGVHGAPENDHFFTLQQCELGLFNRLAWNLLWNLKVIHDLVIYDLPFNLTGNSNRRLQILRDANEIINMIDPLDEKTYSKGIEMTNKILYDSHGDEQHTVYAVGHCHIDTAWLWPYAETRRKVIRSWASQLKLMKLYNYHFAASQAQQYQWLLEDCPELFKRIQDVSQNDKTFHIVGGTWIEMDGNIPSGESFVRQFLYGQEFFVKHFGRRCKIFWLPDTFGYSAQLPQIIRQCDINYFLTQKLSWNKINKFPHHSFIWEGIDGSSVLTHFPPADTYVSQCKVTDVLKSRDNYKNKSCNNESLMLFGWGDGGGGPTTMHLERVIRYAKNNGINGLPKLKLCSPLEFFDKLSEAVNKLPRYVGELYFETHRGTYTTNAMIKNGNRQCESLLQFIEFIYSMLCVKSKDVKYPLEQLNEIWKLVLLNQFHDVLPGTSIAITNIDAKNIYDTVMKQLNVLLSNGLAQCAAYLKCDDKKLWQSNEIVVNNRSWKRREILKIENTSNNEDDMKISQISYDKQRLVMVEVASYSVTPLKAFGSVDTAIIIHNTETNVFIMQNALIYVQVLPNGIIYSLIHKPTNKQVIKIDANSDNIGGNNFLVFEDKPLHYDAWDAEIYHLQKYVSISASNSKTNSMKIIENGPLRCGVEFTLKISEKSTITQRIFVEAENSAILFETDISWHEKYKFLKVQFPLNIRCAVCNYDIQFGFLQRPTVMNNTQDIAKFEVVGHKYGDLSEYDFGAALINDSKYGYSCFRNLLRLSLLRSPKKPDENTDMHQHLIKYCLLPHQNTLQKSNVIQYAQNYNQRMRYYKLDKCDNLTNFSFCKIDTNQIILDTIKMSQDENNDLILRLYEAFGGRTDCIVTIFVEPNKIKQINACNLLEDVEDGIDKVCLETNKDCCQIKLSFTPFEIKSVKIVF